MKKLTQYFSILVLFLSISCDSATDDKDSNTAPKNLTSEALKLNISNAPAEVLAFTSPFNLGFVLFDSYSSLKSADASFSDGTWTWTYSILTVTATKQDDGTYTWKYILNDGDQYDNWVFMEATLSADASSGSWTLYEDLDGQSSKSMTSSFSTSNGITTATLNIYSEDTISSVYTTTIKEDGSGSFSVTEDGVKTFSATWNADGTGSWTDYTTEPNPTGTW